VYVDGKHKTHITIITHYHYHFPSITPTPSSFTYEQKELLVVNHMANQKVSILEVMHEVAMASRIGMYLWGRWGIALDEVHHLQEVRSLTGRISLLHASQYTLSGNIAWR